MPSMNHHRLVCLDIEDADGYANYRAGMEPILARHGGRFLLDVCGGEARYQPADFEVDRVLIISFPDAAVADGFFADPEYVAVRKQWFEPAVAHTFVQSLP